jgi:hypothetical protein
MQCEKVEIEMPEGYKKEVIECEDVDLPRNIKGETNKIDLILIGKYLEDLKEIGISRPKLFVRIYERYHMKHPEKDEYEIREMTDKEYYRLTGEKVDTTAYLSSGEEYSRYTNKLIRKFD